MGRRRTGEAVRAPPSISPAHSTTHLPSHTMTQADRVYEHLQHLPESVVAEMLDFVQFLEQLHQRRVERPVREPGSTCGQMWMADDFDAPLAG